MNFQKIFDQNVLRSFANATMLPMTSFKKLSVILIFEDPSLRSGCPPMAERTFCQSGKCDFPIIDGHPERREGSSIGPYHRQICFYQNLGKFCLRMTANAVANTRRRYGGINPHTEGITQARWIGEFGVLGRPARCIKFPDFLLNFFLKKVENELKKEK